MSRAVRRVASRSTDEERDVHRDCETDEALIVAALANAADHVALYQRHVD